MKKKIIIKIIIIIALLLVLLFLFKLLSPSKYSKLKAQNDKIVANYFKENFPNYKIIDEKYNYTNGENGNTRVFVNDVNDYATQDMILEATLQNKDTDMLIGLSLYHTKDNGFKEYGNGDKSYKTCVEEYSKFYDGTMEIIKKYNVTAKISEAQFSDGRVQRVNVFVKKTDELDADAMAKEILSIDSSIIDAASVIVANDAAYQKFDPWTESNINLNVMFIFTTEEKYDLCDYYKSYLHNVENKNYYNIRR